MKKDIPSSSNEENLFLAASIEEAEAQLEFLEAEFQKMIWDSDDKQKKSLLYSSLYHCSRIILEYKKKAMEHQYQKELLHAVLRAEELEKERIAKTIHDDFGLYITGMKMQLSFLLDQTELEEQQRELLVQNVHRLEEMRQTMRSIVEDLAPPSLKYLGYFKCIEELTARLNCSKLQIRTSFPPDRRLEPETEIHLFRITQELINNIIKHTKATKIYLNFVTNLETEEIRITFDDKGITSEEARLLSEKGKGSGLQNIISRAQLINANVEYKVVNEALSQVSIVISSFDPKD